MSDCGALAVSPFKLPQEVLYVPTRVLSPGHGQGGLAQTVGPARPGFPHVGSACGPETGSRSASFPTALEFMAASVSCSFVVSCDVGQMRCSGRWGCCVQYPLHGECDAGALPARLAGAAGLEGDTGAYHLLQTLLNFTLLPQRSAGIADLPSQRCSVAHIRSQCHELSLRQRGSHASGRGTLPSVMSFVFSLSLHLQLPGEGALRVDTTTKICAEKLNSIDFKWP